MVTSIKSTMSDLGPTNPVFNSHLEAFRKYLLPTVVVNWENLLEENQKEVSGMFNFYCKLHL